MERNHIDFCPPRSWTSNDLRRESTVYGHRGRMATLTFAQTLPSSIALDLPVRCARARVNIEQLRMGARLRNQFARDALEEMATAVHVDETSAFVLGRTLVFT